MKTVSAKTRSGWQALGREGRKEHTWGWMPEEYGILGVDGKPVEGNFCENCGAWEGPQLKRGELARLRSGLR